MFFFYGFIFFLQRKCIQWDKLFPIHLVMKIKGVCVFVFCNVKQEWPSSGHGFKKSEMGNFPHFTQAILQ